jgi:hypothetical protein
MATKPLPNVGPGPSNRGNGGGDEPSRSSVLIQKAKDAVNSALLSSNELQEKLIGHARKIEITQEKINAAQQDIECLNRKIQEIDKRRRVNSLFGMVIAGLVGGLLFYCLSVYQRRQIHAIK